MGNVLGNLKPAAIWNHFEKICSIPHPSTHEAALGAYMKEFCTSCGCEVIVDEVGNVIAKKAATKGMEDRRTVVLQCHLDMVPQKNADTKHDFKTDPIKPRIEGDVVKATGTTLGADNGIGVAAIMALLESKDVVHGPIEALFTIDEEQGMTGANALKPGILKGDILLNLDTEEDGEICIGCAGGMDAIAEIPYKEEAAASNATAFKVTVSGLKGGHSGCDIHLNRGNANKVLTRVLWGALQEMDLRISSYEGGNVRNAIPRESWATITVPSDKADAFTKKLETISGEIKHELRKADPGLAVTAEKTGTPAKVWEKTSVHNVLNSLYACPNGPLTLVPGLVDSVETSTNLGVVKSENGIVKVTNLLRSSVDSRRPDVANMIGGVFKTVGSTMTEQGGYPGWEPYFESPVLKVMKDVYKKKYGKEVKVTTIHAGLECGLIRAKYPKMDALSFGPTIKFPHSPDELVEIPTVEKFWDYLTELLKEIPKA